MAAFKENFKIRLCQQDTALTVMGQSYFVLEPTMSEHGLATRLKLPQIPCPNGSDRAKSQMKFSNPLMGISGMKVTVKCRTLSSVFQMPSDAILSFGLIEVSHLPW